MQRSLLFAGLLAAMVAGLPAAPAMAQRSEKVLTIFGDEPCPTSNGEEIVVCRRLPENERYRIPKDLRGADGLALSERWGDRAQSLEYVGAGGVNTCTPVGAGGQSGCFKQLVRQARQESHDKGQDPSIPLKLP
ncbi:hypothetical protein [Sphingomonas profundi]|uniref:hypothetical protein n=1 Tax=Alterirhizorhabdus profundi TaxID=2681549 RepID=UPI001E4A3B56|nr:hypothetical protein [Sphingomonas profundi]